MASTTLELITASLNKTIEKHLVPLFTEAAIRVSLDEKTSEDSMKLLFEDAFMKALKTEDNVKNKAWVLTLGEQSENHVGMVKYGNGLSEKGYSVEELREMKKKFEEMNCECEIVRLNDFVDVECEEAHVLIMRNCVDKLLGDGTNKKMVSKMLSLKWDDKYWDTRRSKVLNKKARYNLCFGDKSKESDLENGVGTVVGYDEVEILKSMKTKIEEIIGEDKLECEGNYYYNAKTCGIGFHGDSERKKVIGISLCTEDVVREINWIWYKNSVRVGQRAKVFLKNGDCYVMSEKASGFDWKKRSLTTLRHAAGVKGSKYLK